MADRRDADRSGQCARRDGDRGHRQRQGDKFRGACLPDPAAEGAPQADPCRAALALRCIDPNIAGEGRLTRIRRRLPTWMSRPGFLLPSNRRVRLSGASPCRRAARASHATGTPRYHGGAPGGAVQAVVPSAGWLVGDTYPSSRRDQSWTGGAANLEFCSGRHAPFSTRPPGQHAIIEPRSRQGWPDGREERRRRRCERATSQTCSERATIVQAPCRRRPPTGWWRCGPRAASRTGFLSAYQLFSLYSENRRFLPGVGTDRYLPHRS